MESGPQFVACGVEPAFSPDGTEIVNSTWYDRPPGPGLIEPADILVVGIDGAASAACRATRLRPMSIPTGRCHLGSGRA
jgi:hypothetical protein